MNSLNLSFDESHVERVRSIVKQFPRSVQKRIDALRQAGYYVAEKYMPSGGILQVRKLKNGEVRIQVSGLDYPRLSCAQCVIMFEPWPIPGIINGNRLQVHKLHETLAEINSWSVKKEIDAAPAGSREQNKNL